MQTDRVVPLSDTEHEEAVQALTKALMPEVERRIEAGETHFMAGDPGDALDMD